MALTMRPTGLGHGYYKEARNQLDDGLFGQSLILSQFNYAEGRVYGVEFTGSQPGVREPHGQRGHVSYLPKVFGQQLRGRSFTGRSRHSR